MINRLSLMLFLCLPFLCCSCGKLQSSLQMIKADTAYNQGNFNKSIDILKKLIEADSTRPEYYYKLGISYYSNGDKKNAREQIEVLNKMGRKDLADDLIQLTK